MLEENNSNHLIPGNSLIPNYGKTYTLNPNNTYQSLKGRKDKGLDDGASVTNSAGSSNNVTKANKIKNLTYEKSMTSNTLDRNNSDVQEVPKIIFSEVPDENELQIKLPEVDFPNKVNLTTNQYELGIIPEESSIANTPVAIMNKKGQNKMTKYEFVRCKTQLHVGDDLEDLISEVNLLSINNDK